MSRDIIEAVRTIEREKGIEENTLIRALEDALLAAYKKTPGASRHATVELDPNEGEFRVYSIELPADIEERLIDEARSARSTSSSGSRKRPGSARTRSSPTTTSTSTGPTSRRSRSSAPTSRPRTSAGSLRRRPSR